MGIGDALALADPTNPNAYIPPTHGAGQLYVNPVQAALGLPAPPQGAAPTPPPTPPADWDAQLSKVLQSQGAAPPPAPTPSPPKQIKFVDGAAGVAPGGTPVAPSAPVNIQPATAGASVLPAHDVQIASGAGLTAKQTAATEAKDAIDAVARAKYEENENNAQALAGYQGTLRGGQLEQDKADSDSRDKVAKAYDDWKKAQDVDPDHYMSSMSAGKSLRGQGGPNPILQQIDEETKRDIDAQKSKRDKMFSLYAHARENGLDEEKAHALVYAHNAELAKAGLDASLVGNASPVRLAEAEQHKAAIDDASADYLNKAFGRAQAQVVGGGNGWTPAMAKEAQDLYKSDHDKGGQMSLDQAIVAVARTHRIPYSGGPSEEAPQIKTGQAGAGRSAGVQMEYQNNLNRYDAFLSQLDEAEKMVNQGGTLDAARTARGKTLLNAMSAELGYVNAGKSPNETELQTAQSMLPSDLNAYQFTGADKAKLAQVRKIIEEKRAALLKTGPQIAGGGGFIPGQGVSDAAAAAGATEQ